MTYAYTTKWLGVLASDPDTTLYEHEPGVWWYNSTEKRWKFWDGEETRTLPVRVKKAATADLTIPIGGGGATASLTLADFGLDSKIEALVRVSVLRREPIKSDVYAPEGGINSTSDAVGLTLFAGHGTTLVGEVVVLGY